MNIIMGFLDHYQEYIIYIIGVQGRIQDFKLGGAHLKKLRRTEGGAKIFGVFRVKNHDFTPKNHIFSNFRGSGVGALVVENQSTVNTLIYHWLVVLHQSTGNNYNYLWLFGSLLVNFITQWYMECTAMNL